MKINNLLSHLGIQNTNYGSCFGKDCWISTNNQHISSINPTTGETIATVEQTSNTSYKQVIGEAEKSFLKWREKPAPLRGQLIRDVGNLVRENIEPLGELIALEMGKIKREGIGEVQEVVDICEFAVGLSRQLYGLTMHSERPGHRMYEQWHPIGPTGIITAFNFPAAPWAWNAIISAVCGNTVIWKPSEVTPLTAIALQNITNEIMSDHKEKAIFNLITGTGSDIGSTLVNDKRIPLISFTGSVKTGRIVSTQVAKRLGKSILELGGNNAIIVTKDADLKLTSEAILFGSIGTTGQRCTTTRRIIAHKSIINELIETILDKYKNIKIGDPLCNTTTMGPMISQDSINKMLQAIETAKNNNGLVIYGGQQLLDLGPLFVEPVIIKMNDQIPLLYEETFAPILYIMEYNDFDEAISLQNSVPQGLSSAIFTSNLYDAETFLSTRGSDCGIANVNVGTTGAEIGGAFGGEKETGGGRESGSDAWKGYMRRQTVTINWTKKLPLSQGIDFSQKEID
ncbi:MAG TPA: aldehyde dehydrogenase family protein [Chloroflexi bacterium]|nr:aldehyde dehydrogenase family protein [Chloroflexota bacterium]|tara:strand:- start:1499 stop:3037 length:1539 start_codon:yes stop_codon:yes gene_type:complete